MFHEPGVTGWFGSRAAAQLTRDDLAVGDVAAHAGRLVHLRLVARREVVGHRHPGDGAVAAVARTRGEEVARGFARRAAAVVARLALARERALVVELRRRPGRVAVAGVAGQARHHVLDRQAPGELAVVAALALAGQHALVVEARRDLHAALGGRTGELRHHARAGHRDAERSTGFTRASVTNLLKLRGGRHAVLARLAAFVAHPRVVMLTPYQVPRRALMAAMRVAVDTALCAVALFFMFMPANEVNTVREWQLSQGVEPTGTCVQRRGRGRRAARRQRHGLGW